MNHTQSTVTTIANYTNLSTFCRTSTIHGGVSIFCKSHLTSTCRIYCTKTYCVEKDFEIVAIVIGNSHCIACIYRSPQGNLENFLSNFSLFLFDVHGKFNNIIIVGDLNVNSLATNRTEQNKYKEILNICTSLNLCNLVNDYTRIDKRKGFTAKAALDHVFTNIQGACVDIIEPHISDHTAQITSFDLKISAIHVKESNVTTERNFSEQNMRNFCFLFNRDSHTLLGNYHDINDFFFEFSEHFRWCLDMTCPSRTRKRYNRIVTSDPIMKQEIPKLNFLHSIAIASGDADLMNSYKAYKIEVNNKIIEYNKTNNISKIQNSNNKNKTIWEIVNRKLGKSKNKNKIRLKVNNKETDDSKEVSNLFAYHYSNFPETNLKLHFQDNISETCTTPTENCSSFFFHPTTPNEVSKIILNLKNKSSTGVDEIPVKLLKYANEAISIPFAHFINLSLELGQFPDELKIGKVIPVYKRGDMSQIENFRPIVLLSYLSKIIEKLVTSRIYDFIESKNIFSNCQYGYRTNRSTESACTNFVQKLYEYINVGKKVAAVFFDLTAAFDTVNHTFLHSKLYNLGIRGTALNWIMSYLTNRKITVSVDEELSELTDLTLGVGQGSIIGPLLFIIFVNDLPHYLPIEDIFMYADDTTFIVRANNAEELENKTRDLMKGFEQWCWRNSLIMNSAKTVVMKFSSTGHIENPQIANKTVSTTHKFLGVVLDTNLTFKNEIDRICEKLAKNTFAMLNLKKELPIKELINCYYSLCYSVLSFNIILWGQSVEVERIFIVQKRILRIMFNLGFRESCKPHFKTHNILTLTSIYIFKIACFIHEKRHTLISHANLHEYPTRHRDNIYIDRHRLEKYKHSPLCAGSYIYNKLPKQIKSATTFYVFKKLLKEYLLKEAFYNLNEFFAEGNIQ